MFISMYEYMPVSAGAYGDERGKFPWSGDRVKASSKLCNIRAED